MTKRAELLVVLGVPCALILGSALAYYGLLLAGVDREGALDNATVALPIMVAAILHGVHRSRGTSWSLDMGGMMAVLVAVAALALRSISLASSRGPLFYYSLASASTLAYVAHRFLRAMVKRRGTRSDSAR
jgi:hypothetical protein